jgi:hypothetical protein
MSDAAAHLALHDNQAEKSLGALTPVGGLAACRHSHGNARDQQRN